MRTFSRYFLVPLVCMAFLAVLGTTGCSCKKDEESSSKFDQTRQAANQKTGEVQASTGNESHRLDECKKHWYYISPGESASVVFEMEVDANMAKAASTEEPAVRKEDMEKAGYSVSYSTCSVDTVSLSLPVWTVSNSDFAVKENEKSLYTTTDSVAIRWKNDGVGIIEKAGDRSGQFEVGKLSGEELSQKLGGKSTVHVIGPKNVAYDLSPSHQSMDKQSYILSVILNIGVPTDTSKILEKRGGNVSWEGNGISFEGYYNNRDKKFAITGPARSRECLR
ncbi:MAG: hypothetical protein A4E62_02669 [Syntrophorhabdus sp. PtaU1.Bin002]|nr:MAG: hypothetical protein A4E62_02669 [Syntrophorhabdus sp. PtaU1.Bin002]